MSPRIQAKLLRFIESGEYRPVGGTENRSSNIRIIAAGQPLRLDGESLRPDLKSRIAQLDISLLPLWEIERRSPGTLYKIAFILLERYSWTTVFHGNRIREMTPSDIKVIQEKLGKKEIIELLSNQKWAESNIRQLNNFLRKWIVFGDKELQQLSQQDSPRAFQEDKGRSVTFYDEQLETFLVEPKNREELKLLFSKLPLRHLKKSYIRHLFKVYSAIIEQDNEKLEIPLKPTQKELAKLMGVTENTISRHLN
jgi:DNA-binding NtrC family response regulator